jgi:hypothetical protein
MDNNCKMIREKRMSVSCRQLLKKEGSKTLTSLQTSHQLFLASAIGDDLLGRRRVATDKAYFQLEPDFRDLSEKEPFGKRCVYGSPEVSGALQLH